MGAEASASGVEITEADQDPVYGWVADWSTVYDWAAVAFIDDPFPFLNFGFADPDSSHKPSTIVGLDVESSHCYPSRAQFFREIERVLKPDGTFAFADVFFTGGSLDIRATIEAELREAGLLVTNVTDLIRGVIIALADSRGEYWCWTAVPLQTDARPHIDRAARGGCRDARRRRSHAADDVERRARTPDGAANSRPGRGRLARAPRR